MPQQKTLEKMQLVVDICLKVVYISLRDKQHNKQREVNKMTKTYTTKELETLTKELVVTFNSSCIEMVYIEPTVDMVTNQVVVFFTSGSTYSYDLPFEIVKKFVESDSIGRAYHKLIRGKFESYRM